MIPTAPFCLQAALWPEYDLSTELELYAHLNAEVTLSIAQAHLRFQPGGRADFATAANLFNIGKWRRACGLQDLQLRLQGAGEFALVVFETAPEKSWKRIYSEPVTLEPGTPFVLDLTPRLAGSGPGTVHFSLTAISAGQLDGFAWETRMAPRRTPDLALSITTFKREAAVKASVARFESFVEKSPLKDHLHLIVVDNGKSAGIATSAHVTPIDNENLGGSGGFSRGLLAAEARGASHCLFMDDDASVHFGAVERTWTFLAYTLDDKTAVAGGMTMANHAWAMWENGATFFRNCRPEWIGTDLRQIHQVLAMEHGSDRGKPGNFYGGWWYFAFPIKGLTYRPFPFFVRGDDVSFSIANRFAIETLPGVICFQDADFSDKESLQTLYLDLRSHLAHHLVLDGLDIGRAGLFRVGAQFFARSMMQAHYDSTATLRLAVEDVLKGPDFFAQNADMAQRRAHIAAMRKTEAYAPLNGPEPASRRRFDPRKNHVLRSLMKYSLNGHLLPFFGYWGNRVTLRAGQRGQLNEVWGAARITYISTDGRQSFTVRHSKWRALREGLAMLGALGRLAWRYPQVRAMWKAGYADLTQGDFWAQRLGLTKAD